MPSNDGSYQKWRMFPDEEGYWSLMNLATGLALDSNAEGKCYTMAPNQGSYQRWKLTPS